MYIVPGISDVKIACITLKTKGIELFGFLLYTDSDRVLVDYIQDGIFELDRITGDKCAVFVIEPPSKRWFSYVKQKQHTWWKMYGDKYSERNSLRQKLSESVKNLMNTFNRITINDNSNCQIVVGVNNTISLDHIVQSDYNTVFDRQEALNIAKHFGLEYRSLPCLVFFDSLDSKEIVIKELGEHTDRETLKTYFRIFFDSTEFQHLIKRGVR